MASPRYQFEAVSDSPLPKPKRGRSTFGHSTRDTMRKLLLALLSSLSIAAPLCHGFYVPGWSPHTYRDGDIVPLWLNKVSSERTHLPYAYAELSGVCKPTKATTVSLNLGEILRGAVSRRLSLTLGDRISKSDYNLKMGQDVECAHLCDVSLDKAAAKQIYDLIHDEYLVEWYYPPTSVLMLQDC